MLNHLRSLKKQIMLDNLRQKRYVNSNIKRDISVLCSEIRAKRRICDEIVICPTPTEYSWMGVQRATKALFPSSTIELPQFYSKQIYSDSELEMLIKFIVDLEFKNIIFSGFPPYFKKFLEFLKIDSKIRKGIIYHGFFSEMSSGAEETDSFNDIIELSQNNKIDKIGFVKKDFSVIFNKMYGVKAYDIIYKTPEYNFRAERFNVDKKLHIGVFPDIDFRKNYINQMIAALLVDKAIVHTSGSCELKLDAERIISHDSNIQHIDFVERLYKCDINLYVTFSESWGQVIAESLSVGVPCLASNNSGILDLDPYLKEMLIVNEYDNPIAIANQIEIVLANIEQISKKGIDYIAKLNLIAEDKLKLFLNI